jgi:hypothetical protein
MKASRNLLPILLAFVSAAPMLHADSDPRGTYNGTMQPTYINQQLLNRNPEVYFKPGDDPDDSTIHSNILDAIDTLKQATRAMNVLLIVGGSPGQFNLFIDTGGGLWWNPEVDDSYENPQIAWSADGFSASKAGVPFAYHITGHYRGPAISGEWSVTVDGAAVISGTFCASKTGSSGGCSAPTAPAVPAGGGPGSGSGEGSNSGGTWVHTGSGNDADDYTWVPNSEPPGISSVNDVPGPADLPETGTGILLPGLLTMAGIGLKSLLDSSVTPPPMVDYGSVPDGDSGGGSADGSDGFTDSMTDSLVNTPPAAATPAPSPYGADYDQAVKDSQNATNEYNGMLQQYADFQNGADTTDPQYKVLDQQYKDYLDYLKNKADSNSASADAIAAAVVKQQNTQVLKDYWGNDKEVVYDPTTGQWHDAQTGNLFDPDAWQKSQQDNANADAWGQSETQKMENQQDADSKAMKQLIGQENLKEKELEYLEKLQETGYNKDIIDPGGPHDFFTSTQQLMDDITDGKTVTVPQIRDAEKYLHDRLTGSAQPESSLSSPEYQDNNWQYTKTALWSASKEMLTGRNADGHFTVLGVMGMIGLHGLAMASGAWTLKALGTKWVGEEVLTAASTVFTEQDAIDHGASSFDALVAGYTDATAALVFNAAGEGLHSLATNPSVKAGVGEMFDSATNFGKRMLGMPVPEALTPELQKTKDLVTRLVQSQNADPLANSDLLAQIYSNGGMKKLGELQAAGMISKEEAAALNAQLHPLLNRHINLATYNAIMEVQEKTGVGIKQVIVADSGSTAKMGTRFDAEQLQNYADSHGMSLEDASKELQSKYGNPKCVTDRDATVLVDFDQADVEQYARDHSISVEDAYHKLHNLCTNNIRDNVNSTLVSGGFKGGINDVKFQTYAGIGTASGRADAYGAGVCGRTMEAGGGGKQWVTDAAHKPTSLGGRSISGTAVVDQSGLNELKFTGELPPNPDKFSPDEFANYSGQQVSAVMQGADPKTVAKAVVRQAKLGKLVDHMSGNEVGSEQLANAGITNAPPPMNTKLVQLSQKIADNPDNADAILSQAGLTKQQYQLRSFNQVQTFNNALTGCPG